MSDAKSESSGHIIQSLVVNALIAAAKAVAAVFTGSGAMLAEAIHSGADCGNQLLLLRGVVEARKPADALHPLGYGRNVYFWSFMVALLLFTGGGVFSIYEGLHKLSHPEPLEHVPLALGILGFALLLESWATWGNIKALNARRGSRAFFHYLRETKDSDLVVVFGENAAAVVGLFVALGAILIAHFAALPSADAIGSIVVGVVLVLVAVFLAIEVKSLLVGESADPEISEAATKLARADSRIDRVIECVTMQQGPGEVLVALKIRCEPNLVATEISGTASMDFGGKRNAGVVTGIIDGFVYLGTGAQSLLYASILPHGDAARLAANWGPWPWAMIPVALVGLVLASRVWNARPQSTRAVAAPGAGAAAAAPAPVSPG